MSRDAKEDDPIYEDRSGASSVKLKIAKSKMFLEYTRILKIHGISIIMGFHHLSWITMTILIDIRVWEMED